MEAELKTGWTHQTNRAQFRRPRPVFLLRRGQDRAAYIAEVEYCVTPAQ